MLVIESLVFSYVQQNMFPDLKIPQSGVFNIMSPDKPSGATAASPVKPTSAVTPKIQNRQHAANQPQQSAFYKDSPRKQLIDSMNMVVSEASSAIDKEVGPDAQTLNVENALNLFVREGYVSAANTKSMEMLMFKVMPRLQDEAGVIQRSVLVYYLSALYLVTRLPSIQEGSFEIEPIISRYTLPNLLVLAQKTVQLRFNHVAHSLSHTSVRAEEVERSFIPEINSNAKTLSDSYWSKLCLSPDDVYKRVSAWTEHRNKVREETRQKANSERATELTFIPSINKRLLKYEEKKADTAKVQTGTPTQDTRRQVEDAAATRLYDQGMARHKKIQNLHTKHVSDKMKQELEQCTFSPQIRELKQRVINGSGLVSSTDSHRRSIASAISRMRQSITLDTPTKLTTSKPRKQNQSLMKTLDLVVSPSPPFSTSRSVRSITPRVPYDTADRGVREATSSVSPSRERSLSTAGILTEETYSHRNPKTSRHSGGYQRSTSGTFRPSTCESFNTQSFRDDTGFRSIRSLSRSYSPIHPARDITNDCISHVKSTQPSSTKTTAASVRPKDNPARIASFKNYKIDSDMQKPSPPKLDTHQDRSVFLQKAFFEAHNPSPSQAKEQKLL